MRSELKSPTPIKRQMNSTPVFPTPLHQKAAESACNFFLELPETDTFLVVNSCARGLAVPESDLDFAVLVKPATQAATISEIEN